MDTSGIDCERMPPSLHFKHQSQSHQLEWGDHFAIPREQGFRDTAASELTAIVSEIESGQNWRSVVDAHFATKNPWLHSIITSPSRTAFFGSVLPEGDGEVLDIGAADIEPPPAFGARVRSDFIHGVGKVRGKFVLLLDVDRALSIDEIASLAGTAADAPEPVAA